MEKEDQLKINPNSAGIADLLALPGVGESMAQRIVAGRPYQTPEAMLQVKGLGERSLERMRPFLSFTDALENGPTLSEKAPQAKTGDSARSGRPTLEERLQSLGWSPQGSSPTSSQVLWLALITGSLSVLLSVFFSLAFLVGINRTLNIERHAAVRELRAGFAQIDSQLGNLEADLTSIDQRLKAVEGLSGRMATLETAFELVQEDVDRAMTQVDQLTEQVTGISNELTRISSKVNLFDAFLEGIRGLMADLFAPEEALTSP